MCRIVGEAGWGCEKGAKEYHSLNMRGSRLISGVR